MEWTNQQAAWQHDSFWQDIVLFMPPQPSVLATISIDLWVNKFYPNELWRII